MNHQGLLWNVHCVATVVLRKQLNFKSAVIRSNRSSSFVCLFVCLFLFLFFVGEQTQTSSRPNFESRNLWYLFAKSCWNINTRTMLRILFSLLVCKIYFLLVLSKRWIRREIIKTLKKVLSQPWNALTLQLSLSLRDESDRVYFTSLFRQELQSF